MEQPRQDRKQAKRLRSRLQIQMTLTTIRKMESIRMKRSRKTITLELLIKTYSCRSKTFGFSSRGRTQTEATVST
jgi:hypothetical protein